jgi:hypothetical protein
MQEPYTGLLPQGFSPQASQAQLNAAVLKNSKLAVVPSANFEAMAREWVDRFEGEGRKASEARVNTANAVANLVSPLHLLFGAKSDAKSSIDEIQKQTDPRRLMRELMPTLIAKFADVEVLPDIATAREKQKDMILVIDYYGSFNEMGSQYASKVGYHGLDKSLKQLFKIERSASVKRIEPSAFLASASDYVRADSQTIVNAILAVMNPGQAELLAKLPSQ